MEMEEINAVLGVLGTIAAALITQQAVGMFIPQLAVPVSGIGGDITIDDIGVSPIDDHLCYGIWWLL